MMLLYNASIRFMMLAFHLGRYFNRKLKAGWQGRENWESRLLQFRSVHKGPVIWFHCASLGEFEMARPLIDRLSEENNGQWSVFVTFFSPSGYEARNSYKGIQGSMYLPFDTKSAAERFVHLLQPRVAVFVKYEFWLNLLRALNQKQVTTLLINGLFRKDQPFFAWWGSGFREALQSMDHIFVQNHASRLLLESLGVTQTTVTGDLRYDRVVEMARQVKDFPELKSFLNHPFIAIGGSTWPEEETLLLHVLRQRKGRFKLILVPHNISESNLHRIERRFKEFTCTRFSRMQKADDPDMVLVDTIGHLGFLYRQAHLALVGGGFTGALHNILEAAVAGIPVVFGPEYRKFPEAAYFREKGIGFSVNCSNDLLQIMDRFERDLQAREALRLSSESVFKAHAGGTAQVYYKLKGYLSRVEHGG